MPPIVRVKPASTHIILNKEHNMKSAKYTANKKYALDSTDATTLYKKVDVVGPEPSSRFKETAEKGGEFSHNYKNNDLSGVGGTYTNDCGKYARSLMRTYALNSNAQDTVTPNDVTKCNYTHTLIGKTSTPSVGQAYYIEFDSKGKRAQELKTIDAPWNKDEKVLKGKTNFHVAAVVAKDAKSTVTSEVNAAFEGHNTPWFNVYKGTPSFYKTFKAEYTTTGSHWWSKHPPMVTEYNCVVL